MSSKFAEPSAQLGFPTPKDPSAYVDCLAGWPPGPLDLRKSTALPFTDGGGCGFEGPQVV